jgi:hypothetical protein
VNAYDFPGLVGGVAGAWLFFLGTLLAVGAGLRLAWLARRPGKGRIARGLVAAGATLSAAGIALFWAAEQSALKREIDLLAPWAAVIAVVGAAYAAVRIARRPAPGGAEAANAGEPET